MIRIRNNNKNSAAFMTNHQTGIKLLIPADSVETISERLFKDFEAVIKANRDLEILTDDQVEAPVQEPVKEPEQKTEDAKPKSGRRSSTRAAASKGAAANEGKDAEGGDVTQPINDTPEEAKQEPVREAINDTPAEATAEDLSEVSKPEEQAEKQQMNEG